MMRATWNGIVLADSDRTKVVEGNHYFSNHLFHTPLDEVFEARAWND